MADKFVNKRADITGSGAASGDVIYVTEENEVYDVVNTKLKLTHSAIRVSAGVWATLNPLKTLQNPAIKPINHVTTKAYAKNSLVVKDGDVYSANADIAKDTAWATGTTGATWKKVTAGATVYTRAVTGTGSTPSWVNVFSVDKNSKFDRAGALTVIRYPSTITSSASGTGYAVIVRPSSSDVATAFKTGQVWNVRKVFTLPANSSGLAVSGFDVTAQDYLGWVQIGGSNTALITVNGDSFHWAYATPLSEALTEGQNVTITGTGAYQSGGLGWGLTV